MTALPCKTWNSISPALFTQRLVWKHEDCDSCPSGVVGCRSGWAKAQGTQQPCSLFDQSWMSPSLKCCVDEQILELNENVAAKMQL